MAHINSRYTYFVILFRVSCLEQWSCPNGKTEKKKKRLNNSAGFGSWQGKRSQKIFCSNKGSQITMIRAASRAKVSLSLLKMCGCSPSCTYAVSSGRFSLLKYSSIQSQILCPFVLPKAIWVILIIGYIQALSTKITGQVPVYPMILCADDEGPDQTARMRSLIWAFAVRICPKTRFRMAQTI